MTPFHAPRRGAADEGLLSPHNIWFAVRKRLFLVTLIIIACAAAMTARAMSRTRIYRAETTLKISPQPTRPLGNQVEDVAEMGAGYYWDNQEYYVTQHKILQSRGIAQETVRRLGLAEDASFILNQPEGTTFSNEDGETAIDLQEAAVEALMARLTVEPIRDTRIVSVRFDDAVPERAERVLSAISDAFMDSNIESVLASAGSASEWLDNQAGKLKEELEDSEMKLHDYKVNKKILSVSLDDQSNMLREEMQQLNRRLVDVQAHVQNLSARSRALRDLDKSDSLDLSAREFLDSHVLQSVRAEFLSANRALESLRGEGKGENHPDVIAARGVVETTKKALHAEISNVRNAVDRELSAATSEAGGLSGLFEAAKKRAMDLNILEIEYRRLGRDTDNTEKLYSVVLERSKEANLARVMRFNNISIIDPPKCEPIPIYPKVPRSGLLGVLLGILLGVAVAIGSEAMDRSVKTPDEVETFGHMSFLGLVPEISGNAMMGPGNRRGRRNAALESRELIVHERPKSGVAEAARSIRTNIMLMSPDEAPRAILVTSAGPVEGKTTVVTSLAIALAQSGDSVLLIDCDLRRPRVHKVFGLKNNFGVSACILNPSAFDPTTIKTVVPGLSVLPAGPQVPNPAELLHSAKFKVFLEHLLSQYDRVLIDSPPVVPVTDAVILSNVVDGTILVVRAFKTSKDLLRQASRSLSDVGAKMIGCILNGVDINKRHKGYYQQYYYYKAEGYGEDEAETESEDITLSMIDEDRRDRRKDKGSAA